MVRKGSRVQISKAAPFFVAYNSNMNEYVKMSIDGRKNAVLSAYDLSETEKKKLDELFANIEALGESCSDAGDFEAKFATSSLNTEYMNLFTEFATTKQSKIAPVGDVRVEEVDTDAMIADTAKEAAIMEAEGAVQTVRGRAVRSAIDKARDIPGVGDAMSAKNKIDLLGRFVK